jgi:hypothetical protein
MWESRVASLIGNHVDNVRLGRLGYVRLLAACLGHQAKAETTLETTWQQKLFTDAVMAMSGVLNGLRNPSRQEVETLLFDVLHQTKMRRMNYAAQVVRLMKQAGELARKDGIRNTAFPPVGTVLYSRPQLKSKAIFTAMVSAPGQLVVVNGPAAGKHYVSPTEAYKDSIGMATRDYGWVSWYYCPFFTGTGALDPVQLHTVKELTVSKALGKIGTNFAKIPSAPKSFVTTFCIPVGRILPCFADAAKEVVANVYTKTATDIPATTLRADTLKAHKVSVKNGTDCLCTACTEPVAVSAKLFVRNPDGSFREVKPEEAAKHLTNIIKG